MRSLRAGAGLGSAVVLAGCAAATQVFAPRKPETLVVVVPSRVDGHVGAVVVNPGPEQQVLDTAYAAARQRQGSTPKLKTVSAEDLDASFAAARQAAPPPPATFTVHFVLGTNLLTSDSKDAMPKILAEVGARSAPDVQVVGHTDQLGPEEYNETLSLRRAESVRDYMVEHGFRSELITAIGRGEREPLADNGRLSNPENRRVEIIVR